MNVVHNIKTGAAVKGTVKSSWMKLTFKAEQIDFEEFVKIHTAFPRIFEPAFRLQQQMMIHTLGEVWWTFKKRASQDMREEVIAKAARIEAKKERKKTAKKNRKIQRNMGLVKYFLCPCYRADYDPSRTAYDKLSQAEKEEWDKQVALARRQAELKLKNPETASWLKFEKKMTKVIPEEKEEQEEEKTDNNMQLVPLTSNEGALVVHSSGAKDKGSGAKGLQVAAELNRIMEADNKPAAKKSYLEEKLLTTQRPREERALNREDRRKARQQEFKDL